jgi:DNA (cytosine-5)-methyltransferase 1
MLGNAVPSLMAEMLAWEIRFQLLGTRRKSPRLKLLPPDRGSAPAPVAPARLPKKYASLIGDYTAHPGTGKGFSRVRKQADCSAI